MRVFAKCTIALGLAALAIEPGLAQSAPKSGTAAASDPAQTAPKRERMICRAEVETGSHARRKRRCFTQAEWDAIAGAAHMGAADLMDRNRGRPNLPE